MILNDVKFGKFLPYPGFYFFCFHVVASWEFSCGTRILCFNFYVSPESYTFIALSFNSF